MGLFGKRPNSRLTTDRTDPRLGHGPNSEPSPQNDAYLILPDEQRKQFVRPVRQVYIHNTCGKTTQMGKELAETYAVNPKFYGATYCVHCQMHKPVSEFKWEDGETVGS